MSLPFTNLHYQRDEFRVKLIANDFSFGIFTFFQVNSAFYYFQVDMFDYS